MAFKPYKPSPHSKGAEKAEERAWMTRKSVAKPTVKAVRDESRKDKAAFVASKATTSPKYRGGPDGDGVTVKLKSTFIPKYRGGPEGDGKIAAAPKKGSNPPGNEMFKRALEFGRPAQAEALRKPSNYTENTFAKLKRKTKALFSN